MQYWTMAAELFQMGLNRLSVWTPLLPGSGRLAIRIETRVSRNEHKSDEIRHTNQDMNQLLQLWGI